MRILMVGGTRFVGKHIVEAARAAGCWPLARPTTRPR